MHLFSNRKHGAMYHIALRSHHPRSNPSSTGHGLSHTTIIIIAVVASVFSFIIVLVFWQLYARYSRRQNAAPLPPVQPLAHQREHQLASFAKQKANSSTPPIFHPSPSSRHSLLLATSDTSLLPRTSDSHKTPSRQSSSHTFQTGEGSEDISYVSHDGPLSPPNPGFYGSASPHPSSSSTSLSSSGEAISPNPTSPDTPFSASSSPSRRSSQVPLNPRNRSSMLSVSSARTNRTSRSRSNHIRGAPHGPHSNVQIVLPTPLAPELYPHLSGEGTQGRRLTIAESGSEKRMSQVLTDRWVPVGSAAVDITPQSNQQPTWPDVGRGRSASGNVASQPGPSRRSTSNPPPASRLRQSVTPSSGMHAPSQVQAHPPVPRIPSGAGLPSQDRDKQRPAPAAPQPSSPPSSFTAAPSKDSRRSSRKLQRKRSRASWESRPVSGTVSS